MISSKNVILVVLTDRWCDWEAAYAIAVANSFSDYQVRMVAVDSAVKVSMGGIRAEVDECVGDLDDFSKTAMVILPGGLSWEENAYDEIAAFVRQAEAAGVLVAAICGATLFLCRHGFLNHRKHTGDSPELFLGVDGYQGASLYVPAQVVADQGFITANETAAVEFAYEIFKVIQVDTPEEIEDWYVNFKNGAVR